MTKNRLCKIFLPLLLLISSYAQADASFSRVFVFGDSLSDTGNLASVAGDFPPPFFENRVSNGPVGVEVLAEKLGHTADASLHLIGSSVGSNYAVAGANALGSEPIDLATQILLFQANHGFVAPPDALYVVFIGGNDVRSARGVSDLSDAKLIVQAAANEVRQAIETLILTGARSFALVNSPNIGVIPETQILAELTGNPGLVEHARKLSKEYRRALHVSASQIEENYEVSIAEFDLYKFFNKLVANADSLGFTNSTEACFSLVTGFHPDCNFDQFVFFDEIHPTARTHALAGEAIFEAVKAQFD